MDFKDFEELEFPQAPSERVGEVYVLLFVMSSGEIPFYVGQTMRFTGRMDDYFWAQFTASTDFKVGEAVRYFRDELGHRIIVRHKQSSSRREEEKSIIDRLQNEGFRLLNHCPNYDYKAANEADVRKAIRSYCDTLLPQDPEHRVNQLDSR
jgi:hypothetical protein